MVCHVAHPRRLDDVDCATFSQTIEFRERLVSDEILIGSRITPEREKHSVHFRLCVCRDRRGFASIAALDRNDDAWTLDPRCYFIHEDLARATAGFLDGACIILKIASVHIAADARAALHMKMIAGHGVILGFAGRRKAIFGFKSSRSHRTMLLPAREWTLAKSSPFGEIALYIGGLAVGPFRS